MKRTILKKVQAVSVHLALLDGVERGIGKIYDDIKRGSVTLNKAGTEAETIGKSSMLKTKSLMETIAKAEEMAQTLGVNIPEISTLKKSVQNAELLSKELAKRGDAAAKML